MEVYGKIKILSSGSQGNCALIYDSRGKCIMLDMGLPWKDILRGVNYDISPIVGALASHNHYNDHTRSLIHCINNGIQCYSNRDVCNHYKGCNFLEGVLKIDGFRIQTFELVHNVPNNAFIIDTIDNIRILYCTDTKYIPKVVKNVNYAIIECNYSGDILLENALNGKNNRSHYYNHQELKECINYLSKIKSNCLRGVILSHISQGNGDGKLFVNKVVEELGLYNVEYAQSGLEMPIGTDDF